MYAFFDLIGSILITLINLIISLVTSLITLITMIPRSVAYIFTAFSYFPDFVAPFFYVSAALSILLVILGRKN